MKNEWRNDEQVCRAVAAPRQARLPGVAEVQGDAPRHNATEGDPDRRVHDDPRGRHRGAVSLEEREDVRLRAPG